MFHYLLEEYEEEGSTSGLLELILFEPTVGSDFPNETTRKHWLRQQRNNG